MCELQALAVALAVEKQPGEWLRPRPAQVENQPESAARASYRGALRAFLFRLVHQVKGFDGDLEHVF